MNFCFKIVLTLFLAVISVSVVLSHPASTHKNDVNRRLPWIQQLILAQLSKSSPDVVNNIISSDHFWNSVYYPPFIDTTFVDVRTALTQLKRLPEGEIIPEIGLRYDFPFCAIDICWDITLRVSTLETSMMGLKDIISATDISPSIIRNNFRVPLFNWTIPNFSFNISGDLGEYQSVYRNSYLVNQNVHADLFFRYTFDPELGVQVDKLTIEFNEADLEMGLYIESGTLYLMEGGEPIDFGPVYIDLVPDLLDAWHNYRADYETGLQFRINCLLSNKRVDPNDCDTQWEGDVSVFYHPMNIIQLVQTIAIGSRTE